MALFLIGIFLFKTLVIGKDAIDGITTRRLQILFDLPRPQIKRHIVVRVKDVNRRLDRHAAANRRAGPKHADVLDIACAQLFNRVLINA